MTRDTGAGYILARERLNDLIHALQESGYAVVGPTVSDGAIAFDRIGDDGDLPVGWEDEQAPGRYRLRRADLDRVFGFVVGPHSLKRFLFPPKRKLFAAERGPKGELSFVEEVESAEKLAVIGARPCDLAAVQIQDRVFMNQAFTDNDYAARRAAMFIVAVNCSDPAHTCFCSSMNTGPRAESGFDLALTEILDADRHAFIVEVGSESGAEVVLGLDIPPASADDLEAARKVTGSAEEAIRKRLDTADVHDLLLSNLEHPLWDELGMRCLGCANCTMVCPTCFCSDVEEVTDLTGNHAERWQTWDSCFSAQHSYIHGGSIRTSIRSRYRQWMTHKLASWIDQFGTSGCVGCGRCITWCPVGIDIVEEVLKLRGAS